MTHPPHAPHPRAEADDALTAHASRDLLDRVEALLPLLSAPSPLPGWSARAAVAQARLAALADEVRAARRPLVVLMLGGTGVGKSSLMNALAGEEISPASTGRRAFTSALQVYHHAEVSLAPLALPAPFEAHPHAVESLRDKLIIDAPDLDSTAREHRQRVEAALPLVDVVIYVTTWQKYRDRALNEVVAGLRGAHSFVFALNQIDAVEPSERGALKADLEEALREVGFRAPEVLPLSATASVARDRGLPCDEEGAEGVRALRSLLWESLRRVEVEALKALSATQRAARELTLLAAATDLGVGAQGSEAEPLERVAEALERAMGAVEAERVAFEGELEAALEASMSDARRRLAREINARRTAGAGGVYGLYLIARARLEGLRPATALEPEAARRLGGIYLRAADRARALAWAHPCLAALPAPGREGARALAGALEARLEEAALRDAPPPRSSLQLNAAPLAALALIALLWISVIWRGGDPGVVGLLLVLLALYGVCALEYMALEWLDGAALWGAARLNAGGVRELLDSHGPAQTLLGEVGRLREAAERARALQRHARALRESGEALSARPTDGARRYLHL